MTKRTKVTCPECGAPMTLRESPKFRYPKSGMPRKFWGCSRYPRCKATHGAHPDGRPVGTPADAKTKEWRRRAHEAFDQLWKNGRMSRAEAYVWLQGVLGLTEREAHIGRFTAEQCRQLVEALGEPAPTPNTPEEVHA